MIERTVGFIGGGTMGEALIRGMLEAGVAVADRLWAADPSAERRRALSELIGADRTVEDNHPLAGVCDVLVLAVKPKVVPLAAAQVADVLTDEHLVISIAAGVTLRSLREALAIDRLIRVMPNTPALVGAGASAFCTGEGATAEDADLVREMLSAVGVCARVEEKHMDAVTGLSGSGPAYVYMAVEALSDGGVKMGLSRRVASRLAAQTVLGAAKMVLETGAHPGELKDKVTTPGGTTIEGLHALEKAGLRKAFIDAVEAATEKSARLGGSD